MSTKKFKLAIIGCGNLGKAILGGIIKNQVLSLNEVIVTKNNLETLSDFEPKIIHSTTDNAYAVRESEVVIVALKPYNILPILTQLKHVFVESKPVLISVATGITVRQMQESLDISLPTFRAMPNTAATVAESLTCICGNSDENKPKVDAIFKGIGETVWIQEDLMNASTVLGACGIAYVFRFMRAMVQGGIQIGFDAKTAATIVNQTVLGASSMLQKNGLHPEHEIDKVTTPKGCTIAGLNEMEHNGFSSALIKGITTSFQEIA